MQDIDNYNSKNKTAGFSFSGSSGNLAGNKGTIDSDYRSVQEQTGIYAGQGGFQINVAGNTDLKGAVIASEATADKNKLVTDTLTFSHIQNKAEYNSDSKGISLGIDEKGKLTPKPEVGIPAEGEAESTTKSAISPADIQVQDKENSSDLSKLSTSPEEASQALEKIFDKKTVQEKQELAKVFGEEAFKLVGDIAERKYLEAWKKYLNATNEQDEAKAQEEMANWSEGGAYKTVLHTMVGGLMASLGGGDAVSGAIGTGVNQLSHQILEKLPSELQEIGSLIVGATAAKIVGGEAETGAATAISATENNKLIHFLTNPKEIRQGLKDGLKELGIESAQVVKEIVNGEFLKNFVSLVKEIQKDPAIIGVIGKEVVEGYLKQVNTIVNGSAYQTGKESAKLIVEIAVSLTAAGATEKILSKCSGLKKLVNILKDERGSIKLGNKGPSKAEVEWSFRNIPEGITTIDGRQYSRHALERMAPDTPEIRAELRTKYNKIAEEKGLVPGSKEYNNFINKNIDPRGITPSVVEDAIRNTKPTPGNTEGTFVHENANVRVIVNSNGDVVTVIPR